MPPDTPMEEMPEARISPNSRFYLQSINGQNYDPKIDVANWSLRIDGVVDSAVESLA